MCDVQMPVNETNVQDVASSVANLTSDPSILTPVDLVHTATILEDITSVPHLNEEVRRNTVDASPETENAQTFPRGIFNLTSW